MKKFKSFYQFHFLILILLISCKKNQWSNYYCEPGKHACTPKGSISNLPISTSNESLMEYVIFDQNSNYQDFWDPYYQVNKLSGTTDCSELIDPHKNTIMFGWRHLDEINQIEILGYVHRPDINNSGKNFHHAPLITIRQFTKNYLKVSTLANHYLLNANGTNYLIMKRGCSDNKMKGRTINPWFGGQKTPPVKITLKRNNLSNTMATNLENNSKNIFPKYIRIALGDSCSQIDNPLDYISQNFNSLLKELKSSCQKTFNLNFIDCSKNIEQGIISKNSIPSLNYELTCK